MRPRLEKRERRGRWGRVTVCSVVGVASTLVFVALAQAQIPEESPTEEPPEAEIEPSPLPGTEIKLELQLPPSEAPPRKRTLRLVPPTAVEPILPPVNFEVLGRSGRLWSFHGVVKEFRFVGNPP